MIQAVAVQFERKLSQKDVLKMSIADRSSYFHQNPITGVWMFQHRIEAFFFEYLLSDAHPLGHITDYVIKIEFQMRGSPHAHCLLWVKDAPKLTKIQMMYLCFHWQIHNSSYTSNSTWKWTSYQTHGQPTKHTHSDYCYRNKSCHFGFPKCPTTKTLISRPPIDDNDEIIENPKSVLQTVQNTLRTVDIHIMSTQHFLQDINLDVETYINALKILKRGPNVILQWNLQDVFINACNYDIYLYGEEILTYNM